MTCKCGGKIRKITAKKPGGVDQYKCKSCHKKFVIDPVKGGLKQTV